jgi:hypothetical protein
MPAQKEFEYKYPNEGRWDPRRWKYITAHQDFQDMTKKGQKLMPDLTEQGNYDMFKKIADEDVPGISRFCAYIISGLDRSQMASVRGKKAPLVRLKQRKVPK